LNRLLAAVLRDGWLRLFIYPGKRQTSNVKRQTVDIKFNPAARFFHEKLARQNHIPGLTNRRYLTIWLKPRSGQTADDF
jgi:hypothetical protein